MLESGITYKDLINRESDLSNHYESDDLIVFIADAKKQLEDVLKNRGLKLRNLCKQFSLSTSKSIEDTVERQRIVVSATGVNDLSIVLYGTNDESSETWTAIDTDDSLSLPEDGQVSSIFHNCFKYYKYTQSGTGTVSAYLIERSFELPHIFLSIVLAYKSLQALNGDVWESKWKDYEMKFEESLSTAAYSYDKDEDGTADDTEVGVHQVTWRR